MPLTLKLSHKFYQALGQDVTNEFVEALNSVDAAYRTDIRDSFEQQFERFDAKLDQRLTSLRAELEQRITSLRADLDMKWTERWTTLDAKVDRNAERLKSELLRWMFGFWISTLAGLGALYLRH
jgi:DNA anti-recombination protein RmuC